MAISWGPWDNRGGNGMRVGIDVSTSSVNASSSSVTFYWKIYTQNRYAYSDNQTLSWSGAASGSQSFRNSSGGGSQVLRASFNTSYTYTSSGSSPGTRSLSASVSGTYNGPHPGVTRTVTIPARPTGVPSAPTIGNAVRASDSSVKLSWTNNQSPNAYTSITVQALINGTGNWITVATLSGAPTSYTDKVNRANKRVQYRVRANNGSGSSAWSGSSPYFYHTPGAPTNVSASLIEGGLAKITWTNNVGWGNAGYTTIIQKSTNAGSTWTVVSAGRGAGATDYTDPTPLAGGLTRYRVAAKAEDRSPNAGPRSAWAVSNDVSVAVPPLAPSALSPTGDIDPNKGNTLSWQINKGADAAAQTKFVVRYSTDAGATWTELAQMAGVTDGPRGSYYLPEGVFPNNATIQWQVRTWGQHADPSPWSASATVTTSSSPAVTILTPVDPTVELPVTVSWDYAQDMGLPQTQWKVVLYDSEGSQLGSWGGSGDQTSFNPPKTFTNKSRYTVSVTVTSSKNLSGTASSAFTLDLVPPAHVTLTPFFNESSGTVSLNLTADAAVSGVTSSVVSVDIQRSIDGGDPVTIIAGLPLDTDTPVSVLDLLPTLNGSNAYTVIPMSDAPSTAIEDPVEVIVNGFSDCEWAFLNWGDSLNQIERGKCNPAVSQTATRVKEVHAAAGRRWPLALIGDARSSTVPVSLTVETGATGDCQTVVGWENNPHDEQPEGDPVMNAVYDLVNPPQSVNNWTPVYGTPETSSPPSEWLQVGEDSTHVMYRDWTGRRVYGVVDEVAVADVADTLKLATVTFTVTRTNWTEGVDLTPVPDLVNPPEEA